MPILFMQILSQTCTVGWITLRSAIETWRAVASREDGRRSSCERVFDLSTPGPPQQIACQRSWKDSDRDRA